MMGPVNMRALVGGHQGFPKIEGEDQWPRKEQWLMGVHRPKRPQGRDPGWLQQQGAGGKRDLKDYEVRRCQIMQGLEEYLSNRS